jgi:hypothetical protein
MSWTEDVASTLLLVVGVLLLVVLVAEVIQRGMKKLFTKWVERL